MAKNLTDVDTFSTPITVPEGTDSRADAAGDVELIAQRLANRTHHLNQHAAKHDAVNTFTAGQQFNVANAATALIRAMNQPDGHPGNPANIWKLIWEAECNDGRRARFYIGDGGNGDGWMLTFNAAWQPDAGVQTWAQDNGTSPSSALWCRGDGVLRWFGKEASAAPWATAGWSDQYGSFEIGNDLTVNSDAVVEGDLTVSGNLTVGGSAINLDVSGNLAVDGDVVADGLYRYPVPLGRVTFLNLFECFGEGHLDTNSIAFSAGGQVHIWPVKLPALAEFLWARVQLFKAGTNPTTLRVYSRTPDASPLTPPDIFAFAVKQSTTAGVGELATDPFSQAVDSQFVTYFIHVTSGDAGDVVYDVEVAWNDPGPRNH